MGIEIGSMGKHTGIHVAICRYDENLEQIMHWLRTNDQQHAEIILINFINEFHGLRLANTKYKKLIDTLFVSLGNLVEVDNILFLQRMSETNDEAKITVVLNSKKKQEKRLSISISSNAWDGYQWCSSLMIRLSNKLDLYFNTLWPKA